MNTTSLPLWWQVWRCSQLLDAVHQKCWRSSGTESAASELTSVLVTALGRVDVVSRECSGKLHETGNGFTAGLRIGWILLDEGVVYYCLLYICSFTVLSYVPVQTAHTPEPFRYQVPVCLNLTRIETAPLLFSRGKGPVSLQPSGEEDPEELRI